MEDNNKKSPLAGQLITCIVFLGVIFGFAIAYLFGTDRDFSDMENRTLAQKPEFTFQRLKDGEFTADIEDYMSDQIAFKDTLVTVKTAADRALGKTYMNGVYFGSDGYYLQDFQENDTMLDKNIGCLNDFAALVDVPCTLLAVPNAVYVMSDYLPAVTQTDDQGAALERIGSQLTGADFVDATPYLQANLDQQIYYRTDHHWTDVGAHAGFTALMAALGETEPQAVYTDTVLEGFYGTLYSKAPAFGAKADEISLPVQSDNDITVRYAVRSGDHTVPEDCAEADGVPRRQGLYDLTKADTKDKYAAIMGGNFGLIEIESAGGEKDEHVLILKDSYTNAMLPYLCAKYKHISLIDLRYYHMEELEVSEYVTEAGIDRVVFLYNVDFLNSDNNFVWLG